MFLGLNLIQTAKFERDARICEHEIRTTAEISSHGAVSHVK